MSHAFPTPIFAVAWDDIPEGQRDFFCFEDAYLPLPESHCQQIGRLTSPSAINLRHWLDAVLPAAPSRDQLGFANTETYLLSDEHWNTEQGRQAVRQWLHDRGIPYSRTVYLFYDRKCVVSLP